MEEAKEKIRDLNNMFMKTAYALIGIDEAQTTMIKILIKNMIRNGIIEKKNIEMMIKDMTKSRIIEKEDLKFDPISKILRLKEKTYEIPSIKYPENLLKLEHVVQSKEAKERVDDFIEKLNLDKIRKNLKIFEEEFREIIRLENEILTNTKTTLEYKNEDLFKDVTYVGFEIGERAKKIIYREINQTAKTIDDMLYTIVSTESDVDITHKFFKSQKTTLETNIKIYSEKIKEYQKLTNNKICDLCEHKFKYTLKEKILDFIELCTKEIILETSKQEVINDLNALSNNFVNLSKNSIESSENRLRIINDLMKSDEDNIDKLYEYAKTINII